MSLTLRNHLAHLLACADRGDVLGTPEERQHEYLADADATLATYGIDGDMLPVSPAAEKPQPVSPTSRDAWGLTCTCTARNRYASWHDSTCDLYQKFPADGRTSRSRGAGRVLPDV